MTSSAPSSDDVLVRMPAETAQVVVEALDLYSRLGMGQWAELTDLARMGLLRDRTGQVPSIERIQESEAQIASARQTLMGFSDGASHSILSSKIAPAFLTAWSVQKAIRHRLAWDRNPQGGFGVHFDEPMPQNIKAGVTVTSAVEEDIVARLPEGMLLTRRAGQWAVVEPCAKALRMVAQSACLQTVVQMACNVAQKAAQEQDSAT